MEAKFMRRPGLVASILAVSVGVISGPAVGAPADVTPDPTIYAVAYTDDYLYSVDPETGVGTQMPYAIGMGGVEHLGGSFNPLDGTLYVTNGDTNECALWSVDTESGLGLEVLIPAFTLPDSSAIRLCTSMMFSPEGELYLAVRSMNNTNYLVHVDFETGGMLDAWALPNNSIPNFLVVSPQDGLYYMQTSFGDDDMYTFDPDSGVFTNVADGGNQTMYGAAFLPDGTILGNSWSELVSVDLQNLGSWTTIGTIAQAEIGVLVNGTNYWPASEEDGSEGLADTGATEDLAYVVGIGSLIAIGLGVLVAPRRRRLVRG